ncbi:glycosyltransferase family 4 protein [Anatilimnocola sp. NA78]|uniref:glycosyltransferase family 4 protein n=1 Tax=Anatilimnocola sp. NA78 TaxID=3415683 RepID=UPI003CE57961
MKTLLVSEIFPPQNGGSGRWLYEIYRRMPAGTVVAAAGLHPKAAEFDNGSGVRTERLDLHLKSWGLLGLGQLAGYLTMAFRLWRLVRRHGAGEVHVARCLPEGFAAWLLNKMAGIPYVVYVHGEETRTSASSRELSWMTRRVFEGCRLIVANSRNTERVLREEWQVPPGKIRVLFPGVDTEWFTPTVPSASVRNELGWGDRLVVMTAGRLQVRKGHDMLIRALPQIQERLPQVLYAIVGEGEERSRLERLADELGVSEHVHFHGEVSYRQLLDCYQQCDLFVLSNREVNGDFEGFGMVLLEAQACGKPVIAGDSGGTRETMVVGESGMIVDCREPKALAEAVGMLLSDSARCEEMGASGRRLVVERFEWTALAIEAANLLSFDEGDTPSSRSVCNRTGSLQLAKSLTK